MSSTISYCGDTAANSVIVSDCASASLLLLELRCKRTSGVNFRLRRRENESRGGVVAKVLGRKKYRDVQEL